MKRERRRAEKLHLLGILAVCVGCGSSKPPPGNNPGPFEFDVNYAPLGSSTSTTLDIYHPSDSGPHLGLGVLAIHGGAWRSGYKALVAPVAQKLALHGFVVFAVNYNLAPGSPWPAALLDLQEAVRFIRANALRFGIDPVHLGAWGVSAGGHLSTMLALVDDPKAVGTARGGRLDAAVDASGPADLTIVNGMEPDEDAILKDLLGAPRSGLSLEQLLIPSTVTYARHDAAVLVLHGTADTFVSIEHSERLFAALTRAGATTQFYRVAGGGHDETTSQTPVTWPATLAFLEAQLGQVAPVGTR